VWEFEVGGRRAFGGCSEQPERREECGHEPVEAGPVSGSVHRQTVQVLGWAPPETTSPGWSWGMMREE
jgi:hypothetical protein